MKVFTDHGPNREDLLSKSLREVADMLSDGRLVFDDGELGLQNIAYNYKSYSVLRIYGDLKLRLVHKPIQSSTEEVIDGEFTEAKPAIGHEG